MRETTDIHACVKHHKCDGIFSTADPYEAPGPINFHKLLLEREAAEEARRARAVEELLARMTKTREAEIEGECR